MLNIVHEKYVFLKNFLKKPYFFNYFSGLVEEISRLFPIVITSISVNIINCILRVIQPAIS